MVKRILSMSLATVMALSSAVPAFAVTPANGQLTATGIYADSTGSVITDKDAVSIDGVVGKDTTQGKYSQYDVVVDGYTGTTMDETQSETEVYATVLPSYMTRIPKVLVLSAAGECTFALSAKGDISGAQTILVNPEASQFDMVEVDPLTGNPIGKKDNVPATITVDDTSWTFIDDFKANGTTVYVDHEGSILADGLTAGSWRGTFNFFISVTLTNIDTDKDGIPDIEDPDDDNDGIPDTNDIDDNNDGILDIKDPYHPEYDPAIDDRPLIENADNDDDGIPDIRDTDDDNDGIIDTEDPDDDNDGIPDTEDSDDNNDGVPDVNDPYHPDYVPIINPSPDTSDFDKDGTPDFEDADNDNDGIIDTEDPDDDNDGIPDIEDLDDNNDGILDIEDANHPEYDPNIVNRPTIENGDLDDDKIPDISDPDDDNDGTPDVEDEDNDNDGIPNAEDPDDNNDGLLDIYDPYHPDNNPGNSDDSDPETDYTVDEIEADPTLFMIGATRPEYVVADFNNDFTEVVITKNGEDSDGVMAMLIDFDTMEFTSPMTLYADTLTDATVKAGVTNIGMGAFAGSDADLMNVEEAIEITNRYKYFINPTLNVTLSNTVESIDEYAFFCSDLKTIKIPEGLKDIKTGAFAASAISNINLPESLESLGVAFTWSNLRSIKIPSNIFTIYESTFADCTFLEEVDLNRVSNLDNDGNSSTAGVFEDCFSLKTVKSDILSDKEILDAAKFTALYEYEKKGITIIKETLENGSVLFYATKDGEKRLEMGYLVAGTEYYIDEDTDLIGEYVYCEENVKLHAPENTNYYKSPYSPWISPNTTIHMFDHNVYETSFSIDPAINLTIYGKTGSYAESMAASYNHAFITE